MYNYDNICPIISLLIIVSATSKSAQFGLHTWLPDAMEGPTPVSALIHAATMVTAGIFLIIKLSNIIENSFIILFIIIFLSSLTSLFAASISLIQNDFKKIIAYSTCSQIGYMLLICGLSNYFFSLFHLFNHAFFKSLLFLSSGLIIHSLFDEQDIRKKGSLIKKNPIASIYLLIGNLSLMGIPFFSGYYSKDVILEIILVSPSFFFIIFFSLLAAFFTSLYSLRLYYYVFLSNINTPLLLYFIIKPNNYFEIYCLFFLFILSFLSGYIFKFFIIFDEAIIINNKLRYIPLYLCLISILFLYIIVNIIKIFKNNLFSFVNKAYLIDVIYNSISKNLYHYFMIYLKIIDIQIINKISIKLFQKNLFNSINFLYLYNRGLLFNYLLFFLLFLVLIF